MRVVLPVLGFILLGWAWAFASPVGASTDEDFHLTSVWCAWGQHDDCAVDEQAGTVTVPSMIGEMRCFVLKSNWDATCRDALPDQALVTTSRFNSPTGNYPPLYYWTLRPFVGDDVERSVVAMRMFNVALAGAVLAAILTLAAPAARRAVALTWALGMVPVGLYFVASVNPNGWAIVGGSTFWAFLYSAVTQRRSGRVRWVASIVMTVFTGALAVMGRSDQVWTLFLSVVALLILTNVVRWRRWTTWAVLGAVGVAGVLFAWLFHVGTYLAALSFHWPVGSSENDQPNPLVRVLSEFPAFIAGHFGFSPDWVARSGQDFRDVPGWVNEAYLYGLGWSDVALPSLVGLLVGGSVVAAVALGLNCGTRRRIIAIAVPAAGLLTLVLVMRSLGDWGGPGQGQWWYIHPRYTLPLLMVVIGLALFVRPASRTFLRGIHVALFSAATVIASSVSLMTVISRYMVGQEYSWVQFEPGNGWWWAWAPDPVAVIVVGAVASMVFFPTTLVGYRRSDHIHPVRLPTNADQCPVKAS